MLRLFRKRAKIILWIIIFGVGIPFILWGTGASRRGLASRRYVGEIYGRKVSTAEYFSVRQALGILALLRGERLTGQDIEAAVWNRIMLLEEARRVGLSAFPDEIEAAMAGIPAFRQGGRFSPETFRWYLQNWGMAPADFESIVADSILISKLQNTVMGTVLLSDAEAREMYEEMNQKISIRYSIFAPATETPQSDVGEEELLAYYSENAEQFKVPERVTVSYVIIGGGTPEAVRPPDAGEIERYYRDNPERFAHGKRVRLRQILVRPHAGADEREAEKVETKIRTIQAELRKGRDLAKLAKKYSDDEATASSGGDLGFVEEGQIAKEISEAAFSMAPGEVKGPIQAGAGTYFIKVEEVQEAGTKKLEEVRDEIAGALKAENELRAAEKADERASERALSLSLKLVDTPGLPAVAREEGIAVNTAGPLSRQEATVKIPRELAEAVFDMAEGEISEPLPAPGEGYVIGTVGAREEERTPPLSEVRDAVVKSYLASVARKTAKEAAEKALENVRARVKDEGIDFRAAAESLGLETKVSPPLPPGGRMPDLGLTMGVNVPALSLATGVPGPVIDTEKGYMIFAPESRTAADLAPFEENADLFAQQYLSRKRQITWLEWFREAQARAGVLDSTFMEEEESADLDDY